MPPPRKQRRATVHDVAAAAGVSRGTVGRVLPGGYVSAGARAAIEAAAGVVLDSPVVWRACA